MAYHNSHFRLSIFQYYFQRFKNFYFQTEVFLTPFPFEINFLIKRLRSSHLFKTEARVERWVLQTAWYQYKQQYKESFDGPEDKLYRHIAYRQLTRWCWGILGKEIRVVLPSCAVMCIRNFYPPPGSEEEFVFAGFKYADE